eukprot:876334-Prorocentrum_minimum.AAC.10
MGSGRGHHGGEVEVLGFLPLGAPCADLARSAFRIRVAIGRFALSRRPEAHDLLATGLTAAPDGTFLSPHRPFTDLFPPTGEGRGPAPALPHPLRPPPERLPGPRARLSYRQPPAQEPQDRPCGLEAFGIRALVLLGMGP